MAHASARSARRGSVQQARPRSPKYGSPGTRGQFDASSSFSVGTWGAGGMASSGWLPTGPAAGREGERPRAPGWITSSRGVLVLMIILQVVWAGLVSLSLWNDLRGERKHVRQSANAMAVAALLRGQLGASWLRPLRNWLLVPTSFLTLGIMLGGWWS